MVVPPRRRCCNTGNLLHHSKSCVVHQCSATVRSDLLASFSQGHYGTTTIQQIYFLGAADFRICRGVMHTLLGTQAVLEFNAPQRVPLDVSCWPLRTRVRSSCNIYVIESNNRHTEGHASILRSRDRG